MLVNNRSVQQSYIGKRYTQRVHSYYLQQVRLTHRSDHYDQVNRLSLVLFSAIIHIDSYLLIQSMSDFDANVYMKDSVHPQQVLCSCLYAFRFYTLYGYNCFPEMCIVCLQHQMYISPVSTNILVEIRCSVISFTQWLRGVCIQVSTTFRGIEATMRGNNNESFRNKLCHFYPITLGGHYKNNPHPYHNKHTEQYIPFSFVYLSWIIPYVFESLYHIIHQKYQEYNVLILSSLQAIHPAF